MNEQAIMTTLIQQVAAAVPAGGTEQNVRTVITCPLWRLWCRAVDIPENSLPTNWVGPALTHRVYGSETILVESDQLVAVSFAK